MVVEWAKRHGIYIPGISNRKEDEHKKVQITSSGRLDFDEREFKILTEKWKNLPIEIAKYRAGQYPDGTPYSAGYTLWMDEGKKKQQVMDSFETPWCEANVAFMLAGIEDSMEIAMRGFGLGIDSTILALSLRDKVIENPNLKYIVRIIELNKYVFRNAEKIWYPYIQEKLVEAGVTDAIHIELIHGEADEEMRKLKPNSQRLILSDLHQVDEEFREADNFMHPDAILTALAEDGRLSICSFGKTNQVGGLSEFQKKLYFPYFRRYFNETILAIAPPHCEYQEGPFVYLPVNIFSGKIAA